MRVVLPFLRLRSGISDSTRPVTSSVSPFAQVSVARRRSWNFSAPVHSESGFEPMAVELFTYGERCQPWP